MRSSVFVVLAAVVVSAPSLASADKPTLAKKQEAPQAAFDVKSALAKLQSGDPQKIQEALDDVRMAGSRASSAAQPIAELLSRGLSPALTQAAIETLGDLEAEAGSAALAAYASHRDVKVRRASVQALIRTRGTLAGPTLVHALSDADAVVRGTAASGLGALKVKSAVDELFVALDHRVNEAAASIGQLCTPDQCERLLGKLGKLPFDVVTTGLEPILFRPTAEISDDAKVKVIGHVRELGTIEGNKFLRDVQKRAQAAGMSKRVRQAVDQGVLATSGGAK